MKAVKALLSVVFAVVLLIGCKGGEKKAGEAESKEAAHEAVSHEASVPSEGNFTVADVFARKDELNGKSVTLNGKVAKVNLSIMGKNWIHLQDGTGSQGTNDITITTEGVAQVNDKVTVTGTVVTNKDYGSGYKYDVIIEDAKVTVNQ
ncbi:MAG: hypothetical protein AB1498_07195 [bacterium]